MATILWQVFFFSSENGKSLFKLNEIAFLTATFMSLPHISLPLLVSITFRLISALS